MKNRISKMGVRKSYSKTTPWKTSTSSPHTKVRRSQYGMQYQCKECGAKQYGINNGLRHRRFCSHHEDKAQVHAQ